MSGITSTDWADFLTQIKEAKKRLQSESDDPIWFRGQNNAKYYLLPGLLRYENGIEKEQYLFNSFKKFADRLFERRDSEWETLFEMQHYGVPTRLLDWSETFGIALFFATFYHSLDNDASIYLLNPLKLNQVSRIHKIYTIPKDERDYSYSKIYWDHRPFFPSAPIAIEPIFINSRMLAQRGMFTVHDDSIEPIENKFPEAIRKVIIPKKLIPAALEFLDLSNINAYSVYPDLGGVSDFIIKTACLGKRL